MSLNPVSNYPTSLDAIPDPASTDKMNQNNIEHSNLHTFENNAIENVQGYVGVTGSAVSSSLTYKVTNASSSNPGHKHTLAQGATDVTATASEVNRLAGVTAGTVAASKAVVADANLFVNALGIYAPSGFMVNGQISRTVSSNNLTVALKTSSAADPSSTDPIHVRIGNTARRITAALSISLTAGTNFFNSGSSELATNEVDYFLYAIYNTNTSTVFLGMSRYSHGLTYADFSATTTSEAYMALSTGTAPASTDTVELIGRFNATLSATASFNWSVPATSVILNRPEFESRWLNWSPTYGGFSANPTSVVALYKVRHRSVILSYSSAADGTSNATSFTLTAPFQQQNTSNYAANGYARVTDSGSVVTSAVRAIMSAGSATITLAKDFASANFTNSGGKRATNLFIEYAL